MQIRAARARRSSAATGRRTWYDGFIYESDITRGLLIWNLSDNAVAGARKLATEPADAGAHARQEPRRGAALAGSPLTSW